MIIVLQERLQTTALGLEDFEFVRLHEFHSLAEREITSTIVTVKNVISALQAFWALGFTAEGTHAFRDLPRGILDSFRQHSFGDSVY